VAGGRGGRREDKILFEFDDKLLICVFREFVCLVNVPRGDWLALVPDILDCEPGSTLAIFFRRETFPLDLRLLDLALASIGATGFGFFTKLPPPRPYPP